MKMMTRIGKIISLLVAFVLICGNACIGVGYAKSTDQEINNKQVVQTAPDLEENYDTVEGESKEQDASDGNSTPMASLYDSASDTASTVTQLDSTLIKQENFYDRIIFNEEKNGIYFIQTVGSVYSNYQSYDVVFYDVNNKTYKTVYSASKSERAYFTKDALYFSSASISAMTDSIQEGEKTYTHSCIVTLKKFDLNKQKEQVITLEPIYATANWWGYLSALGVDDQGRIYLATNDDELHLFSQDGKHLSKIDFTGDIRSFFGFDSSNGNFYYEGTYNWVYWGYNHNMSALMAGNVAADGTISLPEKNLMILYQQGFFNHVSPVRMINEKYLSALSGFNGDRLVILDSNAYDYNDYSEQSTYIQLSDGSLVVSLLNITNIDAVKMQLSTATSEYENNLDISSAGTRCVLSQDESSLIVKTDSNTLTEYSFETNRKVIQATTAHSIYDFAMYDNTCVIVEREGDELYVETIDWKYPSDYTVQVSSEINVGEYDTIHCYNEGSFTLDYTFESSNPEVLSVDENGTINAWKAGNVTLKIKAFPTGVTKNIEIEVKDSTLSASERAYELTESSGIPSATIHRPVNYGYYGDVTTAYLVPLENGGYQRVEYVNSKVLVENYDASFKLIGQKYIECELPLFGGFYSGQQYNFLVFGKKNTEESDANEVIRVVKYDKAWKRLDGNSIYGANTYEPFDAGSLSMAEYNDILYIHTCHTMYVSDDGYHHQANCSFAIQETDMSLLDSYTDVMNLSYGYVSHSFMQLIRTDGEMLYRADLGDAYPRGITLTATELTSKLSDPALYGTIVKIPGSTGQNYTGYTLSGLELSDTNYIIVGSGVTETDANTKNVFISSSNKNSWTQNIEWITNYDSNSNIKVQAPKLVKINNNQFLLLWEEYDSSSKTYETKMVLVGANGKPVSKIFTSTLALSACYPTVDREGYIVWYVTNGSNPILVKMNPYNLLKVQETSKFDQTFSVDRTGTSDDYDDDYDENDGWNWIWTIIESENDMSTEDMVSRINVTGISNKIAAGKKIKLSAEVFPADASNKKVIWKSSNNKVATVTQGGIVTMNKKSGGKSVIITATATDGSGIKAIYKIKSMKGCVKKVTISGAKTVKAGKSLKLKAKVTATRGANKKIKWISNNPKYAVVSSSGKVKTFTAGKGKSVKITAMATDGSGKKKTVTIKIK